MRWLSTELLLEKGFRVIEILLIPFYHFLLGVYWLGVTFLIE